jgi:Mg2+-importing ATPase
MDKLEEIPYDFVRKRLSVVVDSDPGTEIKPLLITKGALDNILTICTHVQIDGSVAPLDRARHQEIDARHAEWSSKGYRVLGVAVREVPRQVVYTVDSDECDMVFAGFLLFFDPLKPDAKDTLDRLAQLGVQTKIITGDNRLVARHVAELIGLPADSILPASEMNELHDEALWNVAERISIFAEVDPNQKERIILALRKMGHVVGYMGDGINDAPALHAADIGISVDQAVDVAKEAADFVLLQRDLGVLRAGIEEGRRTFANTLKYIFTTTSANFGNMLSMAGASLFLPFLPLLPKQILLNNFISDLPAFGIASDNVDEEMVTQPHRWNIHFIRDFMIIFGLVSSVFDYATFGLLLFVVHATEQQFQTGWFIESLLTELVIALVVRTRRLFFLSRPGQFLWISTLIVSLATLVLPYTRFGQLFGLIPLPGWVLAALVAFTGLYVVAAEIAKKYFYKRIAF